MKPAVIMDDPSAHSQPLLGRIDIVRSYPSLANRSVSADATIHDLSDTGFFGTAMLRLARGMHVRIKLPGIGVRDAEITWAEFPNFACAFEKAIATDRNRAARKSFQVLVRTAIGLSGMLLLIALLWTLWT